MLNVIEHRFYNHTYGATVNSSTYFDPDLDEMVTIEHFNIKEFPKAIDYAHKCLTIFFQLSDSVKELFIPVILLKEEQYVTKRLQTFNRKIPADSGWKGYHRNDTVSFSMKSWINRYITCIEVSYVLVNEVITLGLEGMKLTPINVIRKIPKLSTLYRACFSLNGLQSKALESEKQISIRTTNNEIKHHGKFGHRKLSDIAMFDLFFEIFKLEKTDAVIDPNQEINLILNSMVTMSDEVCEHITLVLDEVTNLFDKRFEELKLIDLE